MDEQPERIALKASDVHRLFDAVIELEDDEEGTFGYNQGEFMESIINTALALGEQIPNYAGEIALMQPGAMLAILSDDSKTLIKNIMRSEFPPIAVEDAFEKLDRIEALVAARLRYYQLTGKHWTFTEPS